MAKKIGGMEKGMMYALTGGCDALQFILDIPPITPAGAAINRFLDIAMGIVLGIYFIFRGRGKGIGIKTFLMLVLAFILEEIPIIDALPFWTLDLQRFYSNHGAAVIEQDSDGQGGPLVKNGTRRPDTRRPPLSS